MIPGIIGNRSGKNVRVGDIHGRISVGGDTDVVRRLTFYSPPWVVWMRIPRDLAGKNRINM
jgi:hypothetical protein